MLVVFHDRYVTRIYHNLESISRIEGWAMVAILNSYGSKWTVQSCTGSTVVELDLYHGGEVTVISLVWRQK